MEAQEEKRESLFQWIGNGKKMIIGAILLAAGIVGQLLSGRTLAQIPFVLMGAGLMCFVNALFSKIASCNIHLLLYLIINIAAMELAIAIAGADVLDSTTLYGAWVGCGVAAWIFQIALMKTEGGVRRVVLSFCETLFSAVALVAAFVVPIFLSVWRS